MLCRLALAATAAGLLAASPALAERVCTGSAAENQLVGVTVEIRVDDQGGELGRSARWGLKPDRDGEWPLLGFAYVVQGSTLGQITDVTFLHVVPIEPMPRSARAEVRLRVDGAGDWRLPWQLYARMMAQIPAATPDRRPVAIAGAVPLAFTPDQPGQTPLNLDLIARLSTARTAEIDVVGDAEGEILGQGHYTLSAEDRDRRFARALAEAEKAARNWRRCPQARR